MASDLSKLIQDGLCNTLNSLLAKDTKFKEVTRAHEKDLNGLELLKVTSEFNFEEKSTTLTFMVPAFSASYIFNTMMGDTESEPALTIDDDTADAINEFISNISGGLTTAINAEALDDLGNAKFNLAGNEVIQSDAIESIDTVFRFVITLEDIDVTLFIGFDEVIMENLEEISKSEQTVHEEEPEAAPEEEEVEEEVKNEGEEQSEEPKEEAKNEEESKDEIKNESEDEEENQDDAKNKKLKIIIIAVGALLGLIIIAFLVMYFMGAFDEPEPEPEKKAESNVTKPVDNSAQVVKYNTLKKVDFDPTSIDRHRLNNRLEALTKYEVLNKEELEAQALAEKDRLFRLQKEKELMEFAKNNKEEPIFEKKPADNNITIDKKTKFKNETYMKEEQEQQEPQRKEEVVKKQTPKQEETIVTQEVEPVKQEEVVQTPKEEAIKAEPIKVEEKSEEKVEDNKLKFVLANSLKYKLFKELVLQTNTAQARISICNNAQGRTTIFIGPFENEEMQNKMVSLIQEKNSSIATSKNSITQEEFDARCNF